MRWIVGLFSGVLLAGCSEDLSPGDPTPAAPAAPTTTATADRPPAPRPSASPKPSAFVCRPQWSGDLAPVTPPYTVPDVAARSGAPAPTVTSMSAHEGPWGTTLTIQGSGFGDGTSGQYVSIGGGAREVRIAASCPSDSTVEIAVPIGAEGEVQVHTEGGVAGAGTFTPTWRSGAVYRYAPDTSSYWPTRVVVGSFATATTTYVLLAAPSGTGTPTPLTLLAFAGEDVVAVELPNIGRPAWDSRAAFVEETDGTVDVVVPVTDASYAHHGRLVQIHGTHVDVDDGCLVLGSGALALSAGASGPVAWVETKQGLARVAYARATRTWTIERGPFAATLSGEGAVLADGSVAFAWAASASTFFDDKGIVEFGELESESTTVVQTNLTPALDDSVSARLFATSRGFTVAHCNYDQTGLFADTGPTGSHCHVQELVDGSWRTAPGYPDAMDVGYTFGLVDDAVVTLYGAASGLTYHVVPSDAGSVLVAPSIVANPLFVPGTPDQPVVALVTRDSVVVARQRP